MAAGRWVLGALLLLALSAPAQDLRDLLDGLEGIRREQDVAAFALTLVEGDRLLYTGARGQADRASAREATADTLFRIGSVTKLFNGLAFLMLAEEGLAKLTGSYLPVTWRFARPDDEKLAAEAVTVALQDGRLKLRYPSGKEWPLLAVSKGHFRFPGQSVATVALVEEGGVLYLQGDMGNYERAPSASPQAR